ncbi:MAG: mechanosensitive ion channel family protein [Gammaproteobacteria bacterium]|nr:mechanosensitive ion channel family protein [Gammaproteobacteria bacterium]MYD76912.1 mechanosensitive ion channel family protein [Gammaproteobacteria bacterium]MYJ52882.1 mechanosensitive ion channel family protein [Gammaproteobacteria bacterium]
MIETLTAAVAEHGTLARVLGAVLAIFVVDLVVGLVIRKTAAITKRSKTGWDDALVASIRAPVHWLIWIVGLIMATEVSGLMPEHVVGMVHVARDLVVIVLFAWFLLRFIGAAGKNLIGKATLSGKTIDASLVDTVSRLLRLTVVILAVMLGMQTLGFSLTGVLAFGGVGGIAVGFAAQDMLSNFFGGLMIYLDRPFRVGDWIRSPDREIEGIVESVGWRVTLIRNFDSRPLYVPNSSFSSITIENVSRMSNRRIYEVVGIRYQDAGAMSAIVDDVRSYLQGHDDIDQGQTLMAGFTTFSASSLDFFIYCFTRTQSGPEYFRVKQEILLHILEVVEKHGASCAFPTTTLDIPGPIAVEPVKTT